MGKGLLRFPTLVVVIVAALRLDLRVPEQMPLGVINDPRIVCRNWKPEVCRREAPNGLEQRVLGNDEVSFIGYDLNLRRQVVLLRIENVLYRPRARFLLSAHASKRDSV